MKLRWVLASGWLALTASVCVIYGKTAAATWAGLICIVVAIDGAVHALRPSHG